MVEVVNRRAPGSVVRAIWAFRGILVRLDDCCVRAEVVAGLLVVNNIQDKMLARVTRERAWSKDHVSQSADTRRPVAYSPVVSC